MTDIYGREINYLRISITDRCNLRCVYCMPCYGVQPIPHEQILSFEEIVRLCSIMTGSGISRVKVTGGEPLVRKGAVNLVRLLKAIDGIEQVTMTSNGIILGDWLNELMDAGIDALNISLDTLDADVFHRITRCDGLNKALATIDKAVSLGLPVKINCVPIRNINDSGLVKIAGLAIDRDIAVRFIELMPMSQDMSYEPVPGGEVFAMLEQAYGTLDSFKGSLGNGPAVYYTAQGFKGKLGFISAISSEFCESCNRLRLTSNGILKLCLAADTGLNVKALLRGGSSDMEISEDIRKFILQKPLRHGFEKMPKYEKANMYRIGG